MKKHKNEAALLKLALEIGLGYSLKRGFAPLGDKVPEKEKVECVYRLLVQDKLIGPLPSDKEDGPNMKHRLVMWISGKLPKGHPLLQ
ncbi:TPA: DUF5062 family protein [Shewanella algae]|uniref:DUF5062 family protein n=1 Tax=Shewanella algae TaxID=38313 RepID=UPI001C58106A|nr:DUF5062 family protein [Shewanella algae]MCE9780064.1 DUF5062 family protein [Shewanella algae]MCE9825671.1 DUF5062 family protein [Shewanella algae]HDS1201329.1 DUF5062 family protein [Shewanella algae]